MTLQNEQENKEFGQVCCGGDDLHRGVEHRIFTAWIVKGEEPSVLEGCILSPGVVELVCAAWIKRGKGAVNESDNVSDSGITGEDWDNFGDSGLDPSSPEVDENKQIDSAVQKAVYAAQQLLWAQDGKSRKKFAVNLATELLEKAGITISEGQLSALVEAAVQEMHIARGDYKELKDGTAE